jgi:membrane-associated phospholipid phosphatase
MLDLISRLDANIFILINSHHSGFFDYFFLVVSQLGNGWIAVPLAATVIIAMTPRSYLAKALVYAAIAGTLAGIANTQIKRDVHRPRPIIYFEKQSLPGGGRSIVYDVHLVGRGWRQNSFPSGHAATAFAAATILAFLYGGWFSFGFIPATLVAYSRIYMGVHFPFDVLAGALLGVAVALLVALFFRKMNYLPRPIVLRRTRA